MKITRRQLSNLIRESLNHNEFKRINKLFSEAVEMSEKSLFDTAYTSIKDKDNTNSIRQLEPNWLFRHLIKKLGIEGVKDLFSRNVVNFLTADVIPKAARENNDASLFNEKNYTTPKFPKISFEVEITNYIATQESLIAQVDKLKELFVRLNDFNEALEGNTINASSEEMKQIYEIAMQDEAHYRQAFDLYSTIYRTVK